MKNRIAGCVACALLAGAGCKDDDGEDVSVRAAAVESPESGGFELTSASFTLDAVEAVRANYLKVLAERTIPEDNPWTPEKAELGRHLYFDTRLSADNSLSCASCHDPAKGWTDRLPVSTGIGGKKGGVSAPTIINRLFGTEQFWDGRAKSLEDQALGPMVNPIEMGMPDHATVASRLRSVAGYRPLFEAAFGDEEITIERAAQAIASFERTIIAYDSPFDRYEAGETGALSPSAQRGRAIFFDTNKGRCSLCHSGPNFTDEKYHNIGVGMDKEPEKHLGRYNVTRNDEDKGRIKTPTLRNITETAPYMHDGSEKTLMDVVEFYDKGGIQNSPYPLDKDMKPLNLSDQEKKDLVAFLEALTGKVTKVEIPEPLE